MFKRGLALALPLVLSVYAGAKKNRSTLPQEVTHARTVYVMIAPDAGVPVAHPGENNAAREVVEQSLRQWGHYNVQPFSAPEPDLVIMVRKGGSKQVINGTDPNDRPTRIGADDTSINIGVSHGTPPPLTGAPFPSGPRNVGTQVAPTDDVFEVYLGGGRPNPIDYAPIWTYRGKNALNLPGVTAAKEFQKAVEAALKEEAASKKHP
jgi:hypothetical protein